MLTVCGLSLWNPVESLLERDCETCNEFINTLLVNSFAFSQVTKPHSMCLLLCIIIYIELNVRLIIPKVHHLIKDICNSG